MFLQQRMFLVSAIILTFLFTSTPATVYAMVHLKSNSNDIYASIDFLRTIAEKANNQNDKKEKNNNKVEFLPTYSFATPETTIVGILGGNGKDIINNYKPLSISVFSDTPASAVTGVGIDAGNGKDIVTNRDVIDVGALVEAPNSEATAVGIIVGNGKDAATNEGLIEVLASSIGEVASKTWDFIRGPNKEIQITSKAEAVGINGDSDNSKDELSNEAGVTVSATSKTSADAVTATFSGKAGTTVSLSARASAVGIDGGNGKDAIQNEGVIEVDSAATAESLAVSLTYAGAAQTNVDAGNPIMASSTSTGLAGGSGMDELANYGFVKVTSSSAANAEDVVLSAQGSASTDSSLRAQAEARGIDGGLAKDVLTNAGTLDVAAQASSFGLSIDSNFVDVTQSDLTRTAEAKAVGMDGGGADDEVSNTGTLTATALSAVEAWTVDVNAVDTAIVDSSITAISGATGMTGGAGREELFNGGTVTAKAASSVKAWTFEMTVIDIALGNASTKVDSTAAGIDASVEDEVVINTGSVTAMAASEVETGGITLSLVDLTILQDIGKLAGVKEEYLKPGNASTTLTSTATGIFMDPEDDEVRRYLDDRVLNYGDVTATARSEALSIGVGIGAEGIPAGLLDALQVWEDSNLADASTSLTSTATGIDAGGGDNIIDHNGTILAHAESTVTGVNASLSLPLLEPVVKFPSPAFALAKEGSEAISSATGILTKEGDDRLESNGEVKATADASATGVSSAIIFQGILDSIDKWDIGFGRADATTTSDANAKGIVVGGGGDVVINSADVTAEADAQAVGAAVSMSYQHKVEKAIDIEGTLADADTSAHATAIAIELDEGNDIIENNGLLTASADSKDVAVSLAASIVNKAEKSLVINGALARTDARAEALAGGISADEGNDVIRNTGAMDIDADSLAVGAGIAVTLQGTNKEGQGLMASLINTTTTSQAKAVAIDGGTGSSAVENEGNLEVDATATAVAASVGVTFEKEKTRAVGFSLANAQSSSASSAMGIFTDDEADTILNTGNIDVDATTTSVAASVSVVRKGVAGGATIDPASFDSGNVGTSIAKAITTGAGNDEVVSDAILHASADTTAPSVGVAVSAKGISAALTTSEAQSEAVGVDTGTGNDSILTTGEITTDATSTAVGVSVSVSNKGLAVAGDMVWDGGTTATAAARGIETDAGDDSIGNMATIDASATAVAPSIGVAVTGKGISAAVSTATSRADAVGIDAGTGNELIENDGDISATATSNADAITVAISGKGVAASLNDVWDGGVEAGASAKGIDGGDGDETVVNAGDLQTDATAVSVSVGVSVVGKGIAASVSTSTAEADSTGIEGGHGIGTIYNYGDITGDADATAVGVGVDITGKGIAGAADGVWDGGTTAASVSHGIHTDAMNDTIVNTGKIDVEADSVAPSIGVAITGKGISAAVTTATSHAMAIGLDAGAGDDDIVNMGDISADAFANADAISVSISGKGIAASANDVWDGGAEAIAVARGIDAGTGSNTVSNSGAIDVVSDAVTVSVGLSIVGKGIAGAVSTSTAEAEAIGIDLGDRTMNFANTGPTIQAEADATAVAANVAISGKGVAAAVDAVWDGGATAEATAKGIEAGYVDNTISNKAAISVDAASVAPSVGISITGTGLTAAVTTATSTAKAAAIDTGDGNDAIHNLGVIDSDADATAVAVSVAVAGKGIAGAADAVWDGGTTATAKADGIDGGTGSNTVLNEAAIDSEADATTVAAAVSIVGKGVAVSASTSTAEADATGITLGDGAGAVLNKSQITTDADSTAVTVNVSIAGQGIAGSADAVWDGGTKSTASTSGIRTGASGDVIRNEAKIDSEVDATTVSAGISIVGTGIGLATSTSTATGLTTGIEAGGGSDVVENIGVIEAESDATAVTATISVAGTGIAGTADAVWDGGTKARAGSLGIDAGAGDNAVSNTAKITSEADATTVSAAISVAGTGIGLATSTSTAQAGAVGIRAGEGTDSVVNTGELDVDAASTAVSAQVSVVGTGIAAASDAVWDGGTQAIAGARGIDSSAGSDAISNQAMIDTETDATTVSAAISVAGTGVGISMSEATASAESIGIASGDGVDTIENTQLIGADASSTAVGVSVSVTGLGISGAGGSVWDGGTKGYGVAKAIDSGKDSDTITNSGALTAESSTTSTSVGVAIAAKGIAFTTATSTATTESNAIDAGDGDDVITNTGAILADAESDAVTVQVSVAGVGLAGSADSVWDNGTTATSTARGIYGAAGSDDIWNEGAIVSDAEADTTSVAVSATLAGVAATAATSYAETEANAIDGGQDDDTIINKGDLSTKAESDATTVAVSIVGAGVSLAADSVWDNGTTSLATARGIYGDTGNDEICSEGHIITTSEADSVSVAVSMTLAGVAGTVATSTATTESNSLDGGDGDDTIVSSGTIASNATSKADTVTVSIAGVGAALAADSVWDGGTTATATARGMYGGRGNDNILSDAVIASLADAETDSTAVTATLAGVAGTVVSSTATADAVGIEGGAGYDTIESLKAINSTAIADAASVQVSISGIGASISADSAWDGGTTAASRARGLAGGAGNDSIISKAGINTSSTATSDSTAVAVSLAGVASTTAVSTSMAEATGMDGGTGDDVMESSGAIVASSKADAEALSVSIAGVGVAAGDNPFWDHTTTATAVAQGMSGSDGSDTIVNRNSILATVDSDAEATEVSVALAGVTFGDTATAAYGIATGVDGGTGNDTILNRGAIVVGAVPGTDGMMAAAEADSVGVSLIGAAIGDASATAGVRSRGIDGGAGDDTVQNESAISVLATSSADVAATTVGVLGYAGQEANAVAAADSMAIDGGEGNDTMVSIGTLNALAMTTVTLDSAAFTFGGAADAKGSTTAITNAVGFSGGAGTDGIRSEAKITADAISTLTTEGDTTAVFGYAGSEMTSGAVTVAAGIDGGEDGDTIENLAAIDVSSTSLLNMSVSSFTLGGAVEQDSSLAASTHSAGITGGSGGDSILNEGVIDVESNASLASSASTTSVFGSASGEATSGALTTAAGIDGGAGMDVIENSALVDVNSSATLGMAASGFTLAGGASNEGKLLASTHTTGIAGGTESDSVLNTGDIVVSTNAALTSQVNATAIFGGAQSKATSGAQTAATGIDGGDAADVIESLGAIDVSSTANMSMSSTTFSFAGTGTSEGTMAATTNSTGITGGGGKDSISAAGQITVASGSSLTSNTNASAVFGSSASKAKSGSFTMAQGIDGGSEDDIIESDAILNVTSSSLLTLSSSTFTFGGTASSEGAMAASTYSTGISGGSGSDTMLTGGTISVTGTSTLNSQVAAKAIFGSSSATATSGAVTTTAGIDGGAGNDIIDSVSAIGVSSTSNLLLNSSSYTFGGTSSADGALTAMTRSTGISGGTGEDWIRSAEAISANSTSMLTALGKSNATFGGADAKTSTSSDTDATGIDGGDGGGYLENLASINVNSNTFVNSISSSFVFGGGASSQAVLTARANASGLKGGSGTDVVVNDGHVAVSTGSTMTASGGTSATFGDTETDGLVTAEAGAKGIDVGTGDDTVVNSGNVHVTVNVAANSTNSSDAGLFFYDGGTRSRAGATLTGSGIDAWQEIIPQAVPESGDGDLIVNDGIAHVYVHGSAYSNATADGGDVAWFTGGDASTTAVTTIASSVYGIRANSNLVTVVNNGSLSAVTDPSASAYSIPTGGAFGTDADGWGYGAAAASSDAYGILAGGITNWVENNGMLHSGAWPYAYTYINADGSTHGGSGDADAYGWSSASANVFGISTGSGSNRVLNTGYIDAMASPQGILWSDANGQGADGDGRTGSWNSPMNAQATAFAAGISTGAGLNDVDNEGTVNVMANAYADVYGNADGDTGGDVYTILTSSANATAVGIQTGLGESDIDNSGLLKVSTDAYSKSKGRADRYTGDAVSHSYSPATSTAFGVSTGSGNALFSFDNSGEMEVSASAFSDTNAHGDVDSYAYAHAYGSAYGVSVGDNNTLLYVGNSGSIAASSFSKAYVQDDEPDMQANAGDKAYGIKIGEGNNSMVANTGTLNVQSYASAFFAPWSNDMRSAHTANTTAAGISVGNGVTTIFNDGNILVYGNADNAPKGYNFKRVINGYHGAAGRATGIETGSGDDTIILGENSSIRGEGRGRTVSASGQAQAWTFGVNAGNGSNMVENHGLIEMNAEAVAEVMRWNTFFDFGMPAYATAGITGVNSGVDGDTIGNYGDIYVTSEANASTGTTPGNSLGQTAVSAAYGINAGDGNNVVENYGNIVVSAVASAGAGGAGGGSTATTAVGIKTGSGDDFIFNAGNINTSYLRFQTPSSIWSGPGVAIDSGGGSDTVTLLDGTSLVGDVTLGDGDDILVLTGKADLSNGLIYAGTPGKPSSGYDTANFYGSGAINVELNGFDKGVKTGVGTYRVPGLQISNIEALEGTLLVDNDYSFSPGGNYMTRIMPDGNNGRLAINGTTTLSGNLHVVADHGVYQDDTQYGVLAYERVEGVFDSMNLPGSAILTFSPEQRTHGLDVKVDVASFETVAGNSTERAIGKHLDRLTPTASEELYDVIAEFQWLPELKNVEEAFASVSPAQYRASSREYVETTRRSFSMIQDRLYGFRKSMAFAPMGGKMLALGNLPGFGGPAEKFTGPWQKGFFASFHEDALGETRLTLEPGKFSIYGFDMNIGNNFVAGFGNDYAEVLTTSGFADGRGQVNASKHFVYGSFRHDELYVDAALFYGIEAQNHNRQIRIGSLGGETASQHEGESFSSYIETGKFLNYGSSILQPFCSLEYIRSKEDGFSESGGGPIALKIEERESYMLTSNLGIKAAKMWTVDQWSLIPGITLAWRYDITPPDDTMVVSFAGAPDEYFIIDGKEKSRHAFAIGASLDILGYGKLRNTIDFSGEVFSDDSRYSIDWKLKFNF